MRRACVVGASRGLGLALAQHLARRGDAVVCAARTVTAALRELERTFPHSVTVVQMDVTDARSVAAAAQRAAGALTSPGRAAGLELMCHTAGLLQDKSRGVIPENSLQRVDPEAMAYSLAVNVVGPLMVLKHFAPLLKASDTETAASGETSQAPKATAVFYSARVGSIGDNATGGWYSYRSSKAALNQVVRTASVELARHRVCCFALHPGTVDTDLTRAFSRARSKYVVQDVDEAAENHLAIIASRTMAHTGRFFDWRAEEVPW
ncbi:unnamed protein product [Symbiodinium natans]|uniref:C-factor n=1 Tax=Symbiodinium natans TaxID=878477 RepID=A0A812JES1_9DINO|nr:unnamed protein product [Symbiodinium natans]